MAKGDDIQERLIDFAVESIRLSSTLNGSKEQRHVAGQILRSGTSPAPNYGDARAAESDNDFVHKLKVVLKELNETWVYGWKSYVAREWRRRRNWRPSAPNAMSFPGSSVQVSVRSTGETPSRRATAVIDRGLPNSEL